jgi:hypothetical protein
MESAKTNKRPMSEKEVKVMDLFKRVIIEGANIDGFRQSLTRIYSTYTRVLINLAQENSDNFISSTTADDLYDLAVMIEILDGGY